MFNSRLTLARIHNLLLDVSVAISAFTDEGSRLLPKRLIRDCEFWLVLTEN